MTPTRSFFTEWGRCGRVDAWPVRAGRSRDGRGACSYLNIEVVTSTGFAFRVTATDGAARRGVIDTPHGRVETPAFMPVGTQGRREGRHPSRSRGRFGADIMLGNTYHLYLRPGDDLIARRGGLHRFIGWPRPILTDSGGYQVFSLAGRRTIDRGGRPVPLASRRVAASADPGAGRRHPGAARLRHRDDARRVPGASRDQDVARAAVARTLALGAARAGPVPGAAQRAASAGR